MIDSLLTVILCSATGCHKQLKTLPNLTTIKTSWIDDPYHQISIINNIEAVPNSNIYGHRKFSG